MAGSTRSSRLCIDTQDASSALSANATEPSEDGINPIDTDLNDDPAPLHDASDGPQRCRFTIRRDVRTRIDVYLQQRLKRISRSRIQKLIELGGVTVNDSVPKPSTLIHTGDIIDVILPPKAVRTIQPEAIPLDILYEDDSIIVINKQARLIVHPAPSQLSGTLLNALAYRYTQQQEQAGQPSQPLQTTGFRRTDTRGTIQGLSQVGAAEFRPGIIHRLDRNTTGVIVVAKTDEAHWAIARQFEHRLTLKAYLAVVHGNLDTVGTVIDQPIGKHPTIRQAQAVRHDTQAKSAVTTVRVRRRYDGYCLVEMEPKTGRTHQIRVHLAYIGHPIVGDILYGGHPVGQKELDHPQTPAGAQRDLSFAHNKAQGQRLEAQAAARDDLIMPHPALHAALLRFTHPTTGKPITLTAPVHPEMRQLVQALTQQPVDQPVAQNGFWVDLDTALGPAQS